MVRATGVITVTIKGISLGSRLLRRRARGWGFGVIVFRVCLKPFWALSVILYLFG